MLKKNTKSSKIELIQNFSVKKHIDFFCDLSFASLSTMGCGGKIALTVFPKTIKQLQEIVRLCKKHCVLHLVLGNGSNTLASDDDFLGVVICTKKLNKITQRKNTVICQCGTNTVVLANFLKNAGLSGGEFLYCLPATIGGATVMNAGCFQQSMSDIVKSVVVLGENGKKQRIFTKHCRFGYRKSAFQKSSLVVLEVCLELKRQDPKAIFETMRQMFQKKSDTQPLKGRSLGCVFFNNDKTASRLIDEAGLKGEKVGGAVVSTKHAGFVLNQNNATSLEVLQLILKIRDTVWEKFGQNLQTEIQFVGFSDKIEDLGEK